MPLHIANRPTLPRHARTGIGAIDASIDGLPVFDVTESDQVIVLARFHTGTSLTLDLEAEARKDGAERFLVGSVTLTGDAVHNGHTIVTHGGLFLRPVVTALTGTDVDLILIPVFHGKPGI